MRAFHAWASIAFLSLLPRIVSAAAVSTATAAIDPLCTNSATTRKCWGNGYSIATDFDQKYPTTGVTKSYDLTITNTTCNPDGNKKGQTCYLINGAYPGPVITADWGDYISVTLHNEMTGNGTAIHWHGLRQLGSCGMDGVPGVTECPLAPGQSKTYLFQATQFGTSWYHSHFSAQYGSGIVGAIQINGPASANYDLDLGPFILSDWYYRTAFQIDEATGAALQRVGPGPAPDTFLINGKNKNAAGTTGAYLKTTLIKGKKHLLRLINASVDQGIRVSLDGHNLTIIAADFIPVKPIVVDSVFMAIGQRYEVIVTADQAAGNYWFRVTSEGACGQDAPANNAGLGIFTYGGTKSANPTTVSTVTANTCIEPSPLTPWVSNSVGDKEAFIAQAGKWQVSLAIPGLNTNAQSIISWSINASQMNVDWAKPTLTYAAEGNTSYPAYLNVETLPSEGLWSYWIISNVAPGPPIPHPIHLHGHDFYVLGQKGGAAFDLATDPATLAYVNPTRRDTAVLPGAGWLVIAFPTDNPGAWLMHCHIAWHISEGLGVQFLEAPDLMPGLTSQYTDQCDAWSRYEATAYWKKDGSGL